MNKEHVLAHLKETLAAVADTIAKLEPESDYDEIELRLDLQHAYNHLNTAWNARRESPQATKASAHDDFIRWRQFPHDIDMNV